MNADILDLADRLGRGASGEPARGELTADRGVLAPPGGEEGLQVAGHLAELSSLAGESIGVPFGQQPCLEAAHDDD